MTIGITYIERHSFNMFKFPFAHFKSVGEHVHLQKVNLVMHKPSTVVRSRFSKLEMMAAFSYWYNST